MVHLKGSAHWRLNWLLDICVISISQILITAILFDNLQNDMDICLPSCSLEVAWKVWWAKGMSHKILWFLYLSPLRKSNVASIIIRILTKWFSVRLMFCFQPVICISPFHYHSQGRYLFFRSLVKIISGLTSSTARSPHNIAFSICPMSICTW